MNEGCDNSKLVKYPHKWAQFLSIMLADPAQLPPPLVSPPLHSRSLHKGMEGGVFGMASVYTAIYLLLYKFLGSGSAPPRPRNE